MSVSSVLTCCEGGNDVAAIGADQHRDVDVDSEKTLILGQQ